MLADWRARVGAGGRGEEEITGGGSGATAAGGGGAGAGAGDDGGDVAPEFVKWVSSDHTRPCVALDKSSFFPGVLLSVGDWSFQIWKVVLTHTAVLASFHLGSVAIVGMMKFVVEESAVQISCTANAFSTFQPMSRRLENSSPVYSNSATYSKTGLLCRSVGV